MQKSTVGDVTQTLSEAQAAQVMWLYYKDNKALLASDIRDYRELILDKLMQGQSAIEVFAPFMQWTALPDASNKTCKQRKTAQNAKHKRPAWPFATT